MATAPSGMAYARATVLGAYGRLGGGAAHRPWGQVHLLGLIHQLHRKEGQIKISTIFFS